MKKIFILIGIIAIYLVLVLISFIRIKSLFPIGPLLIGFIFISSFILGVLLNYTIFKNYSKYILIFSLITFLVSLTEIAISRINNSKVSKRANKIIEVIYDYNTHEGRYPNNLKELVPTYIDELPTASIYNKEAFIYQLTDCNEDSLILNDSCKNFILLYYSSLGVESMFSSKLKKWEYYE